MKPITTRVALASALLLLPSACSKDAPPAGQADEPQAAVTQPASEQAAPAPEVDPCTLLMPAEAQELTGKSFGIPVRDEKDPRVCVFEAEGGSTFNYAVMPVDERNGPDVTAAQYRAAGVTTSDAPGIGDRSFWSSTSGVTQLNTYEGGRYLVLTAAVVADSPAQEQEVVGKLMLQILTRL